jgi:hypothetical protein
MAVPEPGGELEIGSQQSDEPSDAPCNELDGGARRVHADRRLPDRELIIFIGRVVAPLAGSSGNRRWIAWDRHCSDGRRLGSDATAQLSAERQSSLSKLRSLTGWMG